MFNDRYARPGYRMLLTLAFLLCGMTLHAQVQSFDYSILRAIAQTRTAVWDRFFITVSDLNNPLCIAVVAFLLTGRWFLREHGLFRKGLFVGQCIIFSQIITFLMKDLIGRLRPQLFDDTFLAVVSAHNKSFPSGHTSEAFCTAFALWISFSNIYVRVTSLVWALLIAYARMYLGVHYPTDVAGGILVAAGSVWLVRRLTIRIDKHRGQPEIVP